MDLTVGVYDGDTSQEHRIWIKHDARLVFVDTSEFCTFAFLMLCSFTNMSHKLYLYFCS